MRSYAARWLLVAFIVLLLPRHAAFAQQPAINALPSTTVPPAVTQKLATDLAKLQGEIAAATKAEASFKIVKTVEVTRSAAPVYAGASVTAPTAFAASKGTMLLVLDRVGSFYAVCAPNNHGVCSPESNTGWVRASYVKPKLTTNLQAQKSFMLSSGNQINTEEEEAIYDGHTTPNRTTSEGVYETIAKQAVAFRDEYKNNSYIQVSGFTVDIGVPPSLEISFSFK